MTCYGRWTYKYIQLARREALGTLIVHETAPASYGWTTAKNSNTNVMYDRFPAWRATAAPASGHEAPMRMPDG